MVFTAPHSRADASSTSTISIASNLCGTVRFNPIKPSARAPSIANFSSAGKTSNATYRQSNPNAAIPAFCIAGEAECRTGCPTTAHMRVLAVNPPPVDPITARL